MRNVSPIGIDLGAHTIKAIQFDRAGTPIASASLRRAEPSEPICADDAARLVGVLYRNGFIGRRVAIAAPKQTIHRLTIDLPPLDSGAPIDAIAQTELCRQRRLEPGTFEYQWYESPQPPRHASGARAIAVSCTHDEAGGVLDLFESHGMTPVAIHSPDAVLADSVSGATFPETTAVLDLGWSDATFVAARNGKVRFVRAIQPCGLGELTGEEQWFAAALGSALRRSLATAPSQETTDTNRDESDSDPTNSEFSAVFKRYRGALAAEVVSSLQYLEGCGQGEKPELLVLTGGGTGVPGIHESLESATGIKTASPRNTTLGLHSIAASLAASRGRDAVRVRPRVQGAAA